jgi:predicted adenylyl cyclase CyaB
MEEIEIKLIVKETKPVTEKLRRLGFRVTVGRHLEKNFLLDNAAGNLEKQGKLLRVRHTPSTQNLTYKGPIATNSKLKHREEVECRIEDAQILLRILKEVGFSVRTEYSKYRTVFGKDSFNISMDETEAGNYLEVEGPSDEEITDLVRKLGYSEKDFVRQTYAELIGERRHHDK